MLSTLLVAAALCSLPAEPPAPDAVLAVRVTATRFVASNPTDRPELVLFTDGDRGHQAALVVPPRSTVDLRFPSSLLAQVEMQLVAPDPCGSQATAPVSLAQLASSGRDALFDLSGGHAHVWLRGARRYELLEARPEGANAPHALCAPAASHVPVVTPYDGRRGDLPPRLEKPLPPL